MESHKKIGQMFHMLGTVVLPGPCFLHRLRVLLTRRWCFIRTMDGLPRDLSGVFVHPAGEPGKVRRTEQAGAASRETASAGYKEEQKEISSGEERERFYAQTPGKNSAGVGCQCIPGCQMAPPSAAYAQCARRLRSDVACFFIAIAVDHPGLLAFHSCMLACKFDICQYALASLASPANL